jgi:hypothetical protein
VVNAVDYYSQATYLLNHDGRIFDLATGALLCNTNATCAATLRWQFFTSGGCGGGAYWYVGSGTAPPSGTYYVRADAIIEGSFDITGAGQGLTVIAEGDITVAGNPRIRPHLNNILFVTNRDMATAGNSNIVLYGRIMVREQLDLAGSASLTGQILVQDAAALSPCVEVNQVRGSPTVTNDGEGVFDFLVRGYREIRP